MKFQEISAFHEKVEKCRASAPTDDRCPTPASLGASGSTRPRHRLFGLSLPQHAAFGAGLSSRSAGDIHFSQGKGRPTHIGSGVSPSPFASPKSPTYSFLHPPTAPDASPPEASGAFFQRAEKPMTFLHAKKTRHIFCEAQLHEKSRYARQKALTGVFDGYLSNLRRDLVPLTLPLLRIGVYSAAIVFTWFFDRPVIFAEHIIAFFRATCQHIGHFPQHRV